jgi:putative tricarboxylic transport membrane protein
MNRHLKMMLMLITVIPLVPLTVNADSFPEKPINLIVGFGVGGSTDRMTRSTVTFLSDKMESPIKVINKPGAGTLISTKYLLDAPADGYNILSTNTVPNTVTLAEEKDAEFSLDDFAFIAGQWYDPDVIAVNKDTPYNNLVELLQAIKEKPGTVKCSVTQGSSGHLTMLLLLQSLNIPAKNLNIVIYQSGGKARAAVAGGQVDVTAISSGGTLTVADFVRPLAVGGKERTDDWDAPTINEALKPLEITIPVLPGTVRGYLVHKDVKNNYPERYNKLVEVFKATLQDEDTKTFLKESQIGYKWVSPEEFEQDVRDYQDVSKKYGHLLSK